MRRPSLFVRSHTKSTYVRMQALVCFGWVGRRDQYRVASSASFRSMASSCVRAPRFAAAAATFNAHLRLCSLLTSHAAQLLAALRCFIADDDDADSGVAPKQKKPTKNFETKSFYARQKSRHFFFVPRASRHLIIVSNIFTLINAQFVSFGRHCEIKKRLSVRRSRRRQTAAASARSRNLKYQKIWPPQSLRTYTLQRTEKNEMSKMNFRRRRCFHALVNRPHSLHLLLLLLTFSHRREYVPTFE